MWVSGHPALPDCPTSWRVTLLWPLRNVFVLATCQTQTCSSEASSQSPTGSGLCLSLKEHNDCLWKWQSSSAHSHFSSFGFFFYSLPEKKVKSVVRHPPAKHRTHVHSFSHVNFCAGTALRDQQQGAAQTKCAGASEYQLRANSGCRGCQHQHPGSSWLPAARWGQTLPSWSPGTPGEPLLLPPMNHSYPLWDMWYVFCGFQLREGLVFSL